MNTDSGDSKMSTRTKRWRDRRADAEKEAVLNPARAKARKRKKRKRMLLITAVILAVIILGVAGGVAAAGIIGRHNLSVQAASPTPTLVTAETAETVLTEEEQLEWQEGWIRYAGSIYEYDNSLLTFLFMGVDKRDETLREVVGATNGGQADALFLMVIDPGDKRVRVIAINRNTMVPIEVYDENGSYVSTVTGQINTQHGFGNGLEQSCEYQVRAVDNLMYNIPIHGYVAVNMAAVKTITDAVGGVDLTVLEDVTTSGDHKLIFKQGDELHMDGETAYRYVTVRDTAVRESANGRLEREKQYLTELIDRIKAQTRSDITTPVKLYNALAEQMVTNITASEVAYLAGMAGNFRFDSGDIYTLEGEYVAAEDNPDSEFDEFYPDEDALQRLIIEVFYKEVHQ